MWKLISFILLVSALKISGQPLTGINFNYLYNPAEEFTFDLHPVIKYKHFPLMSNGDTWQVLYTLKLKDPTQQISDYTVEWQSRQLLIQLLPAIVQGTDSLLKENRNFRSGILSINVYDAPNILSAKVINKVKKKAWIFYCHLPVLHTVTNFMTYNGEVLNRHFFHPNDTISLVDKSGAWCVTYYDDNFPSATPVFSKPPLGVGVMPKTVFWLYDSTAANRPADRPDSVIAMNIHAPLNFRKRGLYLIQNLKFSNTGFSCRVEDDYPRYTKTQNLIGPLVYILTKEEYDSVEAARGNKKTFDSIIVNMAGDVDRAKIIMRSYFKRVERANQYFTTYKEGWKTDRGMIYILFGPPDEVFMWDGEEAWNYKIFKVRFRFKHLPNIFDPNDYVLVRQNKFQSVWSDVVELWRNAKF
jgi:GWxTD domain-containing protein